MDPTNTALLTDEQHAALAIIDSMGGSVTPRGFYPRMWPNGEYAEPALAERGDVPASMFLFGLRPWVEFDQHTDRYRLTDDGRRALTAETTRRRHSPPRRQPPAA